MACSAQWAALRPGTGSTARHCTIPAAAALTQQQPEIGVDGTAEGRSLVEHKGGDEELAQAHEEDDAVLVRLAARHRVGLSAIEAVGAVGVRVKPRVEGLSREHQQRSQLWGRGRGGRMPSQEQQCGCPNLLLAACVWARTCRCG